MKLKLEYGLSEMMHQDVIPKQSYQVRLPEYMAELFNYDSNYRSQIEPEEFKYPETDKDIQSRIRKVIRGIITTNQTFDGNILIVTHHSGCKSLLKIVKKFGVLKPSNESLKEYPKGGISLIFDEKLWAFNPINWRVK